MKTTYLVTGGAGFIGANFVLKIVNSNLGNVINLDKLTYAGNLDSLKNIANDPSHVFIRGDIGNQALVSEILLHHRPQYVVNFAAESHVDRSIHGPGNFIETNVVGTFHLLESVRTYWNDLAGEEKSQFRFLHISTDEVFGSLQTSDKPFTETTAYAPNSPYSASKAASDHLVRAYHHTYGLPVLTTNCSNNYGPYHFPEKLIPLCIHRALSNAAIPVYGDGLQVRDWLFVEDHCSAIQTVLERGLIGETYNVGGCNEKTNLSVVQTICDLLDELHPRQDHVSYREQIKFVTDRPGHDRRYAIDASKIQRELGWHPEETFETGLRKTVEWYLSNQEWVRHVTSGEYRSWIDLHYEVNT